MLGCVPVTLLCVTLVMRLPWWVLSKERVHKCSHDPTFIIIEQSPVSRSQLWSRQSLFIDVYWWCSIIQYFVATTGHCGFWLAISLFLRIDDLDVPSCGTLLLTSVPHFGLSVIWTKMGDLFGGGIVQQRVSNSLVRWWNYFSALTPCGSRQRL